MSKTRIYELYKNALIPPMMMMIVFVGKLYFRIGNTGLLYKL